MSQNEDISHLLNSFTISTNEEKLTHQLDKTHLDSNKTPSIFTVPSTNDRQQQQQQQQRQDQINQKQWDSHDVKNQEEDGWGDAPASYTGILQGTYFGFNSILQPQMYNKTENKEAFSEYKNKPVSFTSALDKQQ